MDPTGVPADGQDQRHHEERQPADDKGPQNDAQGLSGFPFPSRGDPLAFQDAICKLDFHLVEKDRGAGSM